MPSPTIAARIPPELYSQVQAAANRLRISPSELLTRALHRYLDDLQTPVNTPTDPAPDLAQLESRIAALESAVFAGANSSPNRVRRDPSPRVQTRANSKDPPLPLPDDWESLSHAQLKRLATGRVPSSQRGTIAQLKAGIRDWIERQDS